MWLRWRFLFLAWFSLNVAGVRAVEAVPGPDSVAVLANKNIPDSVALAEHYLVQRQVPKNHLCLLDLPNKEDISLSEYQTRLHKPLMRCLTQAGILQRIEAVLLIRGVPLRVSIPSSGRASLAATLGFWNSTLLNGKPALGSSPGYKNKYLFAGWRNSFTSGVFFAGYSSGSRRTYLDANQRVRTEIYTHKPILVTMLHGRSYQDARLLVKSAIDAEKSGGAKGKFLLMKGRDRARGVLDREYPTILKMLKQRGFADTVEEPFKTDRKGLKLAGFVTGTATLKTTIEGNSFWPGSLVDNLTSFGAVPINFRSSGESQVSIARWVAKGVAGAHGTTDEPLNNVFPSRMFLVDYVDGSTLAEAFHRRMPYVYWRNLVLGDPMAAPYAIRPTVTTASIQNKQKVVGARTLVFEAKDAAKRGIATLTLYLNGKQIAQAKGARLEACVTFPAQKDNQLLAVAQAAKSQGRRKYQPKGWLSLSVEGQAGGPKNCPRPEPPGENRQEPLKEPAAEVRAEKPPSEKTTETRSEKSLERSLERTPQEPSKDAQTKEASSEQPEITKSELSKDAGDKTREAMRPRENSTESSAQPEPAPLTPDRGDASPAGCGCQREGPFSPMLLFCLWIVGFVLVRMRVK